MATTTDTRTRKPKSKTKEKAAAPDRSKPRTAKHPAAAAGATPAPTSMPARIVQIAERCAGYFAGLNDPIRLQILFLLRSAALPQATLCTLLGEMSEAALVSHMEALCEYKLVKREGSAKSPTWAPSERGADLVTWCLS